MGAGRLAKTTFHPDPLGTSNELSPGRAPFDAGWRETSPTSAATQRGLPLLGA